VNENIGEIHVSSKQYFKLKDFRSEMRRRIRPFLTLLALLYASTSAAVGWQLTDGALAHPAYRGLVPKKSDVVFSTRFKRPEAPVVAKAFGATRIEWVYSTDEEFLRSLKEAASWFGGAINSNASGSKIKPPSDEAMAKDFDGNSLIHHWMQRWTSSPVTAMHPGRYVTTTHPEARRVLREQVKLYLAAGAKSIQFDDPLLQLNAALGWRGDFNPSTLAGFDEYLANYSNKSQLNKLGLDDMRGDYREFLKSKYRVKDTADYRNRYRSIPSNAIWLQYHRHTVREYFKSLRLFLESSQPPVALSMNLAILDWPDEKKYQFFLAPLADYTMPETSILNTADLVVRAATSRALGIGYVPSIKPRGRGENRVAIATFYALGGQPIVPWDVNTGNDDNGQPKRFFGSVEDYGDLYHFVRADPALFDEKESAAVVGIPVPVHKFNKDLTSALVRRLQEHQVPFAFLLTGGREDKFKIDFTRAKHFKALVMVNPEADFPVDELATLRRLPALRINAADITDEDIHDLSPFLKVGDSLALKLYPRASVRGGTENLVIHLIDEAKGEPERNTASCRRRVGIKKTMIGNRTLTAAAWHSTRLKRGLTPERGGREVFFSIPECTLWGILSLTFER
jgi:hypothetical protein